MGLNRGLLIAKFYLLEKIRVAKKVNSFLNNNLFALTLLNTFFTVNERGSKRLPVHVELSKIINVLAVGERLRLNDVFAK